MMSIDVTTSDLDLLKGILGNYVPKYEVKAFGSRVQGTANVTSYLDLVIMTDKPLDTLKMACLKDELTESQLPFKVDIIDWASTSDAFKKIISRQAIPLLAVSR
ncbi:MAG: nucleotidyltransferase domain-containing protein [Fibrobacteria bacterium]|nr:nucleotidyltransferase domain-containing protein [Fibrobacteria bacterium]